MSSFTFRWSIYRSYQLHIWCKGIRIARTLITHYEMMLMKPRKTSRWVASRTNYTFLGRMSHSGDQWNSHPPWNLEDIFTEAMCRRSHTTVCLKNCMLNDDDMYWNNCKYSYISHFAQHSLRKYTIFFTNYLLINHQVLLICPQTCFSHREPGLRSQMSSKLLSFTFRPLCANHCQNAYWRACVRACLSACVRACVCAWVRACVVVSNMTDIKMCELFINDDGQTSCSMPAADGVCLLSFHVVPILFAWKVGLVLSLRNIYRF